MSRTWLVNVHSCLLKGAVNAASRTRAARTFRPRVEGLEERWCPAVTYFQWKAAASGNWSVNANWNQSFDDVNWIPASRFPNISGVNGDIAQFDGTGTGQCTVDRNISIQQLKITDGGNGNDQIVLGNSGGQNPTYFSLQGLLNWTADGVQINFSGGNTLLSNGGNIRSFKFTGAKGTFNIVSSGPGSSGTVWNTTANSTTNSKILVSGQTFDLQGTGKITSTYGADDVEVDPGGTLKFDQGNNVTVADLFDNGGDGAGYIVTTYDSTTGQGGVVTTGATTFNVTNNMPILNAGSVTVDTGKLTFNNSVPGNTSGVSYYQPSTNVQASTTILHNGQLGATKGFKQDGGKFNVGTGGARLQAGASVLADFEGGSINFPTGTDYETLTITQGILKIISTTVNMKLNGQNATAGNNDAIVCTAGSITIGSSSVLNITVNNALKSGLRWTMLITTLGINDIAGGFGTITPVNKFSASIANGPGETDYNLTSN